VRRYSEVEEMARQAAARPAARRSSPTTGYDLTFTRTVASVLVVAVLLADVIKVGEYTRSTRIHPENTSTQTDALACAPV